MKAVEYFDKYKDKIAGDDDKESVDAISSLILDLFMECDRIKKDRKVSTDRGLISIFKEQNQKWNAVASLFEKNYGRPILVRNGFNKFMVDKIPGLEEHLVR